jgi:hypothetical protein
LAASAAPAVVERCDALDGVADGLVQDTRACQARFNLQRDVPTCTGARDGTCLTQAQKHVIDGIAKGATLTNGERFYAPFPYDGGWAGSRRGAKMIVYHGVSDAIFSVADTVRWYHGVDHGSGNRAEDFVQLYKIPGMNHCSGGPAADQADFITTLVQWVEQGVAPHAIVAGVRGAGNAAAVNTELPASWPATRTRPLCPYPSVARYVGGDVEQAASFRCVERGGRGRGHEHRHGHDKD